MIDSTSKNIPTFAVVGRVNMGKSAVLATLLEIDDNEIIRISPTPGETTECHLHRLILDGHECLRLVDTPGFSRPVEAMRAIQQIHGAGTPGLESLQQFVATAGEEFGDEKRLLVPLLEGAGMLYIIDPAKPLRDDFIAEMEILRWTGRPRLAVLNRRQDTTGADEAAWSARLGGAFNLVRTFDAHHARFDERLRLLKALLEIDERNRATLEATIRLVENEWHGRREEAVELFISYLEAALSLRARATLEERDLQVPSRRDRKVQLLSTQYFKELGEIERKSLAKLLKIYRHHLLKADFQEESFGEMDLASTETWTKWGLSRSQLAAISAVVGGSAGLVVDIATGGLSHGAGAILGALGGGVAAWFKGGALPDLRLDLRGGVKLGTGQGKTLAIGPPQNPNFPWVLLDGMLVRYQAVLARAHGRRDAEALVAEHTGYTRNFPAERRSLLGKWFAGCLKDAPNRALEPEIYTALLETLEEVEDA